MCCEDPPTCCLYASSTLLPTPRPPGSQGMEWPILSAFDIRAWAPKLVICEIQEKQARYRGNARVQADAVALEKYFADAGCEGAGCGEELHTCDVSTIPPSLLRCQTRSSTATWSTRSSCTATWPASEGPSAA